MRCVVVTALALPFLLLTGAALDAQAPPTGKSGWLEAYREPAAFDRRSRQRHLRVGPPLGADRHHRQQAEWHSGTDRAIQWAVAEMNKDGLENAHRASWCPGGCAETSAEIVEPARHSITMLGLGDSVGTTADGIRPSARRPELR
jgi:hypothetical protein